MRLRVSSSFVCWRRALIAAGDDTYSAGGASGAPAAHRKMWNMMATTRLEYGPATRHAHGAPGIGDRDQLAPKTLDSAANHPRHKHRADQGEVQASRICRSSAPTGLSAPHRDSETLALNHAGSCASIETSFSISRNPRVASIGNNNAAPNRIRRRRWNQIRRPNAKLSPRQPCSHPGTNNAICRPSRFECQSIQTTRA